MQCLDPRAHFLFKKSRCVYLESKKQKYLSKYRSNTLYAGNVVFLPYPTFLTILYNKTVFLGVKQNANVPNQDNCRDPGARSSTSLQAHNSSRRRYIHRYVVNTMNNGMKMKERVNLLHCSQVQQTARSPTDRPNVIS